MVSRCVGSLALLLVSSCAAVDPVPGRTGGVAAPPDLAQAVTAAPPADLAMHMPAPAPNDLAVATPVAVPDLSPPPDLGPFPPGALFYISSKATGQLMSIHNSSTINGSITEEQPAHGTADQRWTLQQNGPTYFIVNAQSTTCLDVTGSSTSDGAATGIFICSPSRSQQWQLLDAGGGFYNLVNANSQSCLDLDHGYTTPGTQIFQYHCNGADNQQWLFSRVQ
jgi:hypothetical protein